MHIPLLFSLLIPLVTSTCTRAGINSALDQFFATATSLTKQPLPLALIHKITSNGYIYQSLNATPWANISTLYTPTFKVQALDDIACQGARYTVVTQYNSSGLFPALISLRLGLEDNDGPINEIEILNVIQGDHILFSPQRFEQRTPALFNSSQTFPPGSKSTNTTILKRRDLITTANTYLEGVEKGDNKLVQAGLNCPRVSNGYQTSGHCDQGMQQFKWPVANRRWIADSETGIAFGVFIFRGALLVNNATGDYINEYIAVKDGKLREIRAVMIYSAKDIKPVWPEDASRPYAAL
ncbi:hypothetical protein EJ08DRAFT_723772 [Tothia fuscella]|uniref:DUF8021 domain-containing protein n=1 Tax=Tothia fuscella TaxID=1048955 RepID=A0A9P4TVE0_9PEZI|nr:hypothetical protein EJ08DRAFT_723772 [Tothia fuscella]